MLLQTIRARFGLDLVGKGIQGWVLASTFHQNALLVAVSVKKVLIAPDPEDLDFPVGVSCQQNRVLAGK